MKYNSFYNALKSVLRDPFFRMAEKHQHREIWKKKNYIKKINAKYDNSFDLLKILSYARKHVPFYKDTISISLLKKIECNSDYIHDLPVINKNDVTAAPDLFISDEYKKEDLIRMKTGGSTGHSMYVYYDQTAADWSSATTVYCRSHYENFLCNTQLHFACDFGDPPPPPNFDWRRMGKNLALNRHNIFTMSFDDESLEKYLDSLERCRVNLVHGHPSTMYQIAQYSLSKHGKSRKLFNYFESSGEVIYEYQSETIKKAFGCKILNRYGLAEAGVIAYQMDPYDPIMQIQNHLVYMEVSPVEDPQNIIITTLKNNAMPLIRYDTGDIGVFSQFTSGHYGLKEIQGRIHDFITIGNKKIPTHALMDVFDHRVGGIHEWQIQISKSRASYKLFIVPMTSLERKQVSDALVMYLGFDLDFEIVGHDKLLRVGHRGKFRHLIEVE